MSIKLKGVKGIKKNLESRVKRMRSSAKTLFQTPINPIVSEIKRNLIRDTLNEQPGGRVNHVFTGNLYRNTRSEIEVSVSGSGDLEFKVTFGYFVDYGLDLELGSRPGNVSLSQIAAWMREEFGSDATFASVRGLRNRLRQRGSRAYPIIQPIWKMRQQDYYTTLMSRVRKVWD